MAKKKSTASGSAKKNSIKPLNPAKLRWYCPTSKFKFKKTTNELEPLDKIVGQPRALEAIRLGAELFSKGYNIFVSGLSGTGRLTTVKQILEEVSTHKPELFDYMYVNNFDNPDKPCLIKLNKGQGRKFSRSMDDAVEFLRRQLSRLFEDESYQKKRRRIIEKYQDKEQQLLHEFDEKIRPEGFVRGQIEADSGVTQPEVFPVIDDEAIPMESLDEKIEEDKISEEEAEKLREKYKKYHRELYDVARKTMKIMQEFREALSENEKANAEIEVDSVLNDVKEKFNNERIDIYIERVKKDILENLDIFAPQQQQQQQGILQLAGGAGKEQDIEERLKVYKVNVILDNSETEKAPVITETTPSFINLFGTIEREFDPRRGFAGSDFTKIKSGSLLQADQGYLIVNALDLFTEPGVWNPLKRVLLYNKLEIQPWNAYFSMVQSHIKPEPIEVNVKVIIIGGQSLYKYLYNYEKGFKKIFKVNAQFDYETKITDDMIDYIARFIAKVCNDENLPHCTRDGVAAIVEWAAQHAGSQSRVTLKFSDIADVIREAAFYNNGEKVKSITRENVRKSLKWRYRRNDLIDEKVKDHILEGYTYIDTEGERIGQINGLTVYHTGIIAFGKPARITASVSSGNSGIINIEREADMSGSIHNKGVLIITGFLREKFAQKRPLTLTASIAFEQSYGGIDGDSASAAEIYILLSALAEVPISQEFAITGSVNQKGDIQPIGGVNEKIKGFFEICRDRGFTGNQGVIIPAQNVKDLMLDEEIIEAVKDKKFNIYPIEHIDEGVKLLMGFNPGKLSKTGKYPKDTLYRKVTDKLELFYKYSKEKEESE